MLSLLPTLGSNDVTIKKKGLSHASIFKFERTKGYLLWYSTQSAVEHRSQQLSSTRLQAPRDNTEGVSNGVNTRGRRCMHPNGRRNLILLIVACIKICIRPLTKFSPVGYDFQRKNRDPSWIKDAHMQTSSRKNSPKYFILKRFRYPTLLFNFGMYFTTFISLKLNDRIWTKTKNLELVFTNH